MILLRAKQIISEKSGTSSLDADDASSPEEEKIPGFD